MTAKNTLKNWFTNGAKPTQEQFWAWLDSYWHKDEKINIESINGINELLIGKADMSLIDDIYEELTAAIKNIDLSRLIDDKAESGIKSTYSISKIRELFDELKTFIDNKTFIDDSLENSVDFTYSIDRIKNLIWDSIKQGVHLSNVIDDEKETALDLTYSIDKIKALLQLLSDELNQKISTIIDDTANSATDKTYSVDKILSLTQRQVVFYADSLANAPANPKTTDTLLIHEPGNRDNIKQVYWYNAVEWVLQNNYEYNFIVSFERGSGYSSMEYFINIIENYQTVDVIDNFNYNPYTRTVSANLITDNKIQLRYVVEIKKINPSLVTLLMIRDNFIRDKKNEVSLIGYTNLKYFTLENSSENNTQIKNWKTFQIDAEILESFNINAAYLAIDNIKIIKIKNRQENYTYLRMYRFSNLSFDYEVNMYNISIEATDKEENRVNSLKMDKVILQNFSLRNLVLDSDEIFLPHLAAYSSNASGYSHYFNNITLTAKSEQKFRDMLLNMSFPGSSISVNLSSVKGITDIDAFAKQLQDKGVTVSIY